MGSERRIRDLLVRKDDELQAIGEQRVAVLEQLVRERVRIGTVHAGAELSRPPHTHSEAPAAGPNDSEWAHATAAVVANGNVCGTECGGTTFY